MRRAAARPAARLERPWEHWRAWAAWLVVVYGAVPIGETIHAYHVVGAALVAAGVYLATRPT